MKTIFMTKKLVLKLGISGLLLLACLGFASLGDDLVASVFENSVGKAIVNGGNAANNSLSFMVLVDDDGAKAFLPTMLQIFADNKVEASFFVSGAWVEKNPDLLKSILARGHEIANYGYDTTDPSNLSLQENKEAIAKTNYLIEKNLGLTCHLFMPHFSVVERDVQDAAANCGTTLVVPGLDSLDWGETSPEKIISQVLYHSKAGSLVSLHPCSETVAALPTILVELKAKGMGFATVSHNLK